MLTYYVAPLNSMVRYKVDVPPADYWSNDLYFGKPQPESEQAWNTMLRRKNMDFDHCV